MTRHWLNLLTLTAILWSPTLEAAPIDLDALRSGGAGCPELAADPDVGKLAAFLCRPVDRTILDSPINQTGHKWTEIRAGSFSPLTRASLTAAARPAIGEAEFYRLQDLLISGHVLSRSQDATRIALLADASEAEERGDDVLAAVLRADAAAILGTPETVFDANIPTLLATRPDRDRFADLRSGFLHSLGARDTISHYEQALGETLAAVIGGLPQATDPDGNLVYSQANARNRANPFFIGPDGIRDTADDLPFVDTNERAEFAGYELGEPITVPSSQASFAGTFGDGSLGQVLRDIYSLAAQLSVPSASELGAMKIVELYGVYSDDFLITRGCDALGGATYNNASGLCERAGEDVSLEALARGCNAITQGSSGLNIGVNADGDCIEVNTRSPNPDSQLQFEVIGLLGDLSARPIAAATELVDLTDLRAVADGGNNNTLPARPRADGTGNVSFPVLATPFRRTADLQTGAPLSPLGSQCLIRTDASGRAVGPDGDPDTTGDNIFPSEGGCLLWSLPNGSGHQQLLSPATIGSTHSVNQSLFHTLCTLSFDTDNGFCALDRLNNPLDFGLISGVISGFSLFSAVLMDGVETIQQIRTAADGTTSTTVVQRGSNAFLPQVFLAIEPLASNDQTYQDLGLSLRDGQAALLGCGPAYASACSSRQQGQWLSDPSIRADLTRDPELGPSKLGGIDLMNADASVVTQEFIELKASSPGALVGTKLDNQGNLFNQAGLNFSRTGQQSYNVDTAFNRQGVQQNLLATVNGIEAGAYLTLDPNDVVVLGAAGRAKYQIQAGNMLEADGWIEPMPWTVNQKMLADFGAIVFESDPSNVLNLNSARNKWNLIDPTQDPNDIANIDYSDIDGEYCARWMHTSDANVATPFNLGCTALETVSANFERLLIAPEIIGYDRVFGAPGSLEELVSMLDGDPSNDATGDAISGPDGIFGRNQYVLRDDEMDFEVIVNNGSSSGIVSVPVVAGEDTHVTAENFLRNYNPNTSCSVTFCYLQVNNVLVDPNDAKSGGATLILAMPIGFTVSRVGITATTKVNLAKLQYFDLPALRLLLASQEVNVEITPGVFADVQMNNSQRQGLLGLLGSTSAGFIGRDMDRDISTDLDRDHNGVWDGMDDYTPGPISDDNILCGSGIPGDKLQDGVQYSPYRAGESLDSDAFRAFFPKGLPPRSPVFCRGLSGLLALAGPMPGAAAGESNAFLWHSGAGAPGTDDDADGSPDVLDSCPTIANASQADGDSDGVGDLCDNCTSFPNPRVADTFLGENSWATLTGGQRDDDHDGFGNLCDADFTQTGKLVDTADLVQFRASVGGNRSGNTCGPAADRPCAIFDLSETGGIIDSDDLRRYRELSGKRLGPKCLSCPLVCTAGAAGPCD